jgi:hypothetical protein
MNLEEDNYELNKFSIPIVKDRDFFTLIVQKKI